MTPLWIAFDVSQTGRRQAGCGFYASALVDGLLAADTNNEFTIMTDYGGFFHDPTQALALPYINKGVRYGQRHVQKKTRKSFGKTKRRGGR